MMDGELREVLQQSHDDAPFQGSLPADHPMLQQAQDKLKEQLLATKKRLEEELQERKYAIKAAQENRLNLGVELYGFQQQLAQLQRTCQETESKAAQLAAEREKDEPELVNLREQAARNAKALVAQRAEVDAFRDVLNNTSNELRLLQQHAQEQKGNVLVQKGVSKATERSAKIAAAAQEEQARIIANLEGQIASEHAKHAALMAQQTEQEEKTKDAKVTLKEVDTDIQRVTAENRKHLQHWQENLLKLQRLDATIKDTELKTEEIRQQHKSVRSELNSCRKESRAAASNADKATLELQRLQGENEVALQAGLHLDKQDAALKVTMKQFEESLATTESALKEAQAEGKALAKQALGLEQAMHAATEEIQAAEREGLQLLSSQAAENSAAKDTGRQITAVKAHTDKLHRKIKAVQQGIAATEAEIARVEARSASQAAALTEQEALLKAKEQEVEAGQAGLKMQMQEVDKKGRELDALNRRYEKAVADVPKGEDAGPLEATIHNLKRELCQETELLEEHKAAWLKQQTELHALSVSNAEASEELALLQSTQVVMEHRRARLERQRAAVQKDNKEVAATIVRQQTSMARLNSKLADTKARKAAVEDDIFLLQGKLDQAAKDGEAEVKRLIKQADELKAEKQRLLSEVVRTQRQIKHTEKDVQLTKEMQLALHPEHGQAKIAALEQDIKRAEQRLADVRATQQRLQTKLSTAVAKRETYVIKGRAMDRLAEDRKGPSSMEHKKRQMVAALETNVKEMEKKIEEAKAEAEALTAKQLEVQQECEAVENQCRELRHAQEQDAAAIAKLKQQRCQELILTVRAQRNLKLYKEAEAGKLKISNNLERQLKRARSKHDKLWTILQGIAEANPDCSQKIQRALMHHMYAKTSDENLHCNIQIAEAEGEKGAQNDSAVSL